MKKIKNKRKYEDTYEEIHLGIRKVVKNGNSLSITIPKSIVIKNGITTDEKFNTILIRKKRRLVAEVEGDDLLIQMSKKEFIMFKNFKKEQERLDTVVSNLG